MKNNRNLFIIGGIVLIVLIGWFLIGKEATSDDLVTVKPKTGPFYVTITTTGELQAKNSIDITGPTNTRKAGLWQLKITNLVDEGTVVEKGQFVAELDKSELLSKIKEVEINLQKLQSQYTQAKLDCTLTLSQARDELVNLRYAKEQRKLEKEESIYEAPSTQRQVEIEWEKADRAYNQAVTNYKTKVAQAEAKMREAEADLSKEQQKYNDYVELLDGFSIHAPERGMVVYYREWDGNKRVVGSSISPWDPSVATLPDLTVMESKTFVNEVDIQKIKMGQKVNLGLDADPDKRLSGKVTSVANIGEQRPNSDAKVFEVVILVNESDSTLRPAMTTSNEIVVSTVPSATFIPLECVHSEGDKSFVYKKAAGSIVKQQVELGKFNENEVIVKSGVSAEDELYLSIPEDADELELKPIAGK